MCAWSRRLSGSLLSFAVMNCNYLRSCPLMTLYRTVVIRCDVIKKEKVSLNNMAQIFTGSLFEMLLQAVSSRDVAVSCRKEVISWYHYQSYGSMNKCLVELKKI